MPNDVQWKVIRCTRTLIYTESSHLSLLEEIYVKMYFIFNLQLSTQVTITRLLHKSFNQQWFLRRINIYFISCISFSYSLNCFAHVHIYIYVQCTCMGENVEMYSVCNITHSISTLVSHICCKVKQQHEYNLFPSVFQWKNYASVEQINLPNVTLSAKIHP